MSGVSGEFPTTPETGVSHDALKLFVNDGASKFISGSNFAEYVFGKVSGDATVAAGGALTIAAGAVEGSMLAKIGIISGSSNNSNLTTAIVNEGAGILSGSAQVSADISGSLSAAAVVGLGAGIISGSSSNSSLTTAIVGEGAGILSGSAQIAADVSGSLSAAAIVGLGAGVISASAMVDHDSTTNFVANEHIDHSSVSVIAGAGLTGGGTIAANRTINVVGGTGVTANANDIAIGQDVATSANVLFAAISASGDVSSSASGSFLNVKASNNVNATNLYGTVLTATQATIDHDSLANFVANEHIDHSSVSVVAGTGLTGGGTIAANRTLNVVGGTGVTANANDIAIGQDVATTANVLFAAISASGDISGSQSGSFLNVNVTDNLHTTSGSFDYINATGLMKASGLETSGDIVGIGSSDRELKDNIQSIENPLEKMEKMGGYTFVWNDKQNVYKGKDIGVVAQEIQSVLPEIVATRANGYLGVKYEKIVPLLIESIKELKKEVEDIKQKCDCLNK